MRRATLRVLDGSKSSIISIHALLAESDSVTTSFQGGFAISIHALLAESDGRYQIPSHRHHHFYPRSPCGERHWPRVMVSPTLYFYPRSPCGERRHGVGIAKIDLAFLSTLSLRRATTLLPSAKTMAVNFYPRSPCGERRTDTTSAKMPRSISIHALLAESDAIFSQLAFAKNIFLSTLSLRRATQHKCCGHQLKLFLSTLSLRRATRIHSTSSGRRGISIHALLAESDYPSQCRTFANGIFLSTLSLRRATM